MSTEFFDLTATVAGNAFASHLESDVKSVLVASASNLVVESCSVGEWPNEPGSGNEIKIVFDRSPTVGESTTIGAAVAAHDTGAILTSAHPAIPSTLAVVKHSWTEVTSFAVREGSTAVFTVEIFGSVGPPASVKSVALSSSGTCEYPIGGNLHADTPFVLGANGRLHLRSRVSGNVVSIEIRSAIGGTITFDSKSLIEVKEIVR